MISVRTLVVAVLFTLVATGLVLSPATPVHARDGGEWKVQGDLVGKKDKTTEDLSGIACAQANGFPRTCLVIDDELQAAQVVTLTDGRIRAGRLIRLIDDRHAGKPVELDGEGVAYADGYFYVVGSHGRPRRDKHANDQRKEEARVAAGIAASSRLIRLKYDAAGDGIVPEPDVPPSTALRRLIDGEATFAPYAGLTLEEGGITVEGVAVRAGRLFAGFRGPILADGKTRALVMSVRLDHVFGDGPAEMMLHRLELGQDRGVRDLAAWGNGILILAGPMRDVDGAYSIYRWDGLGDGVEWLVDLPDYVSRKGKQWKPEALLPLDQTRKGLRILVLLDGAKDGKPQELRIKAP